MFGLDEFGAWFLYTLEYYMAQMLWQFTRAFLLIAVLAQNAETWLTENIGTLVEMMVNALATPMGAFLTLAIAALGVWYAMSSLVHTSRWVDPQKLLTYGTITLFFFSSPLLIINVLEVVRTTAQSEVDAVLLSEAIEGMFPDDVGGGDSPIPDPVGLPDVNNDGNIAAFDLVCYLLYIGNGEEINRPEFPTVFAEGDGTFPGFFPHGDPATIELESEETREEAIAFAWNGISQLAYGLIATPTAIAEHVLWLALTLVALLIYLGLPFGLMLSFFTYTEAWFGAYVRQYINLVIETFLSVCIVAFTIGLLAAAATAGTGIYIGMSLVATVIITWRIKGAMKLATAAFDLFGGGSITGGARGGDLTSLAGTAVTGGVALATGGTALAGAAVLAADRRVSQAAGATEQGIFTGQDLTKTEGRVNQLTAVGGYALGHNHTARQLIEQTHELRTMGRNFMAGEAVQEEPDSLDYLRVGASLSKMGSSQWLAYQSSASYREAMNEMGGRRRQGAAEGTDAAPRHRGQGYTTPFSSLPPSSPQIQLRRGNEAWTQLVSEQIDQAATHPENRFITQRVGQVGGQAIQAAIAAHGPDRVREAISQIAEITTTGRQTPAEMLQTFQSGEAFGHIHSPLSESQLRALSDLVLQPQRQVGQEELLQNIGDLLDSGNSSDEDLAGYLGSPTHFGTHTRAIRGVMAGAAHLGVDSQQLLSISARLRSGNRQEVLAELVGQGHHRPAVQDFLSDMELLPPRLLLPQTIQKQPEVVNTPPVTREDSPAVPPPPPMEDEEWEMLSQTPPAPTQEE